MKRALLAAVLTLTACAAPSSYEGLAGGTKEDAAVTAPRPVSPLSVSLVASSRPRLRWDLGNSSPSPLTGAIVEMSRTRDFVKDVKRFEAKGTELVVPEDLELGVWFWRLKGNASGSVGTTPSVVWEMVVRGPAAHGSSDAPTRSMVDMNSDGIADLYIAGTVDMSDPTMPPVVSGLSVEGQPAPAKPTAPMIAFYAGDKDGGFAIGDGVAFDAEAYEGPVTIGGGIDFDGDGIPDIVRGGFTSGIQGGETFFDVDMIFGSGSAKAPFDLNRGGPIYFASDSTALPSVREGGDIDGDGYGDAVVGIQGASFVMLGNAATGGQFGGQPATIPMLPDMPLGKSRIALGAFDANGDGLSDVAFSIDSSYEPGIRAFAAAGSHTQRVTEPMMLEGADARLAIAFAAGDFNGDGLDDIAIATPLNDTTRICMWLGDRDKLLVKGACVVAPPGDTDFGASLTAADLEGDGVDELLVTAKTGDVDGTRVVRIDGSGAATVAPIGVPGIGVRLTTIWPGRPGKARWAAVAGDGSRVAVFEGSDLKTSIMPSAGVIRGFGRGLR